MKHGELKLPSDHVMVFEETSNGHFFAKFLDEEQTGSVSPESIPS